MMPTTKEQREVYISELLLLHPPLSKKEIDALAIRCIDHHLATDDLDERGDVSIHVCDLFALVLEVTLLRKTQPLTAVVQ